MRARARKSAAGARSHAHARACPLTYQLHGRRSGERRRNMLIVRNVVRQGAERRGPAPRRATARCLRRNTGSARAAVRHGRGRGGATGGAQAGKRKIPLIYKEMSMPLLPNTAPRAALQQPQRRKGVTQAATTTVSFAAAPAAEHLSMHALSSVRTRI